MSTKDIQEWLHLTVENKTSNNKGAYYFRIEIVSSR